MQIFWAEDDLLSAFQKLESIWISLVNRNRQDGETFPTKLANYHILLNNTILQVSETQVDTVLTLIIIITLLYQERSE